MTTLGILLEGLPANLTVTYAQQAVAAEFGRIWLPEIIFTDAMVDEVEAPGPTTASTCGPKLGWLNPASRSASPE